MSGSGSEKFSELLSDSAAEISFSSSDSLIKTLLLRLFSPSLVDLLLVFAVCDVLVRSVRLDVVTSLDELVVAMFDAIVESNELFVTSMNNKK